MPMPLCLEKKHTLSGKVQTYSCELVHFEKGFGILKYMVDREYDIKGTKLLPGDVTCALYWEDRPYTLYIWRLKRDESTLYYFNVADSISVKPHEFTWRDLAVDIFIDAGRTAHTLDEDELPQDLKPELRRYIQNAKAYILSHFNEIATEADKMINEIMIRHHR